MAHEKSKMKQRSGALAGIEAAAGLKDKVKESSPSLKRPFDDLGTQSAFAEANLTDPSALKRRHSGNQDPPIVKPGSKFTEPSFPSSSKYTYAGLDLDDSPPVK
jgi:hypothetical protein